MKKIIIALAAVLALAINPVTVNAQQQQGKSTTNQASKQPKTEADLIKNAKPTGRTYTAKDGTKYTVYQGAKGGLFVVRKSAKTGNWYKMYVKEEQLD